MDAFQKKKEGGKKLPLNIFHHLFLGGIFNKNRTPDKRRRKKLI